MATLTDATLRSTLWTNFKAFLDGITFTDSVTITGSFNDSEPVIPQIVFPSATVARDIISLDGSSQDRSGSYEITFFAYDAEVLDRMIDEVDAALKADTTLEADGLQLIEEYWRESDPGQLLINNKKIHLKIVTVAFTIKNLG